MKILKVLIEYSIASLNYPFSYVTENENVDVGFRVYVPFNNQNIVGYVIEATHTNLTYDELCKKDNMVYKYIFNTLDSEAILNDELFNLAKYMEKQYVTPLIGCLQTILPPSYKPSKTSLKEITKKVITKVIVKNKIKNEKLTKRQLEVYNLIYLNNGVLLKELPNEIEKKLVALDLVEEIKIEVVEDYFKDYKANNEMHELNLEQRNVYNEFISSKDKIYLLEGVTGSGKTEVYIEIVKYYLSIGKNAIILVPEISLTPMIIKRFKTHFKDIAILHGSLSKKEKQKQYDLIKDGLAKVVIGARSAIFAPLNNIGVIILDEEQSSSYKQDKSPTYHARDIAIERAKYHNAKVLLGSATPSFESKARACKNVYHLLTITKRANNHPLPHVEIVDMRKDCSDFSYLISNTLDEEIKKCLERKEKVILLHNRRGYSPYVTCRKCGYKFICSNCELSMSYHKNGDKFKCHYCNNEVRFNHKCPKCDGDDFLYMGSGTQKIEEIIENQYKNAKILRMDNDTTNVKNGHLEILNKFENEDYNILLGTQMVAKGLDFSQVTLVGVINADLTLAVADFRSSENTFELLSQVAGRAGRGTKEGKVIIQTYSPENKAINLASTHDYDKFFNSEMAFRHKMNYPPYSFLSTITILCLKTDQALLLADHIVENIKKNNPDFDVLGPAIPYVFKEQEKYRVKIIIKSKNHDGIIKCLNRVNDTFIEEAKERKCQVVFDIDTNKLL